MTIDNHPHYIEDPNATTPPPQVADALLGHIASSSRGPGPAVQDRSDLPLAAPDR